MSRLFILLALVALARSEANPKPEAKANADIHPSYGPPPTNNYGPPPKPSYGPPPKKQSYGPPPKPKDVCPKQCYDKTLYETVVKTAVEHKTSWKTVNQVN